MSYAQDKEDLIVLDFFNSIGIERGTFCDIGAADFKTISNTRLLAERGWGGLLVEPSYRHMPTLLEEVKDFPAVDVLNAAVAQVSGPATFYDPPKEPFISTMVTPLMVRGHGREHSRSFYVNAISPLYLLQRFGPFDFISIDAEGMSVDILRAMPFDVCNTRCICVEFFDKSVLGPGHTKEAVSEVAGMLGFEQLATTAENWIGVR